MIYESDQLVDPIHFSVNSSVIRLTRGHDYCCKNTASVKKKPLHKIIEYNLNKHNYANSAEQLKNQLIRLLLIMK